MIKSVLIYLFLLGVILKFPLFGLDRLADTTKSYDLKSIVYMGVAGGFTSGSDEFFNTLRAEFGSTKRNLPLIPTLAAGTKLLITPGYRFGLQVNYQIINFNTSFEQYVDEPGLKGYRQLHHTYNITNMPIILTADYIPYTSQFRTYTGLGIGMLVVNTNWEEGLSSSIEQDIRRGGVHYDNTDIGALGRIYAGVELGFDKDYEDYFLGSLIIEASYTHTFVGVDFYSRVRQQFITEKPALLSTVNFVPGYLQLTMAVSFNFNRKTLMSKQKIN